MPSSSKNFICPDSLKVSNAIILFAIHQFDCLNHNTKRATCELCKLSVTKNYFYNVSPRTSTLLLLIRSGDVSTNPGPLKANRSIRRRSLVVVVAKVSLPAVEQSRVTPAGSKDLFLQNLNDIDWSDIFSFRNVDIACGKFKSTLLSILDKVAPYKEVRVKTKDTTLDIKRNT